jgi:preprotein translocase subunit SecA
MWENTGYYEILGLTNTATAPEIKRAYFATVRQYPPERFPEEFKRVKKAYDTLADSESRRLYDHGSKNPEFIKHFDLADQAYHEDDYEAALTHLKKALEIAPQNGMARNLMGLCYIDLEMADKAVSLYKKLTCQFPENETYFFNLGEALLVTNAYKQALEAFETSRRLDPDDIQVWIHLAYCHVHLDNPLQARQTLEEGMLYCGSSLSAYLRLIYIDINEDDQELLRHDIAQLVKLAKADPDMQENVAWALVEIAKDLMDEDRPELAVSLLTKAKKLNPAQEIKDMASAANKQKKLLAVLEQLQSDPLIHPWLKNWLANTINADEDDDIFNPFHSLHIDTQRRLFLHQPANVLGSAQRIQEHYPVIFRAQKKFFQDLLKHPEGYCKSESKLLEDLKYLSRHASRSNESDLFDLTLDDFLIPPMPRVNTAKVGRNDPCPCGSGKKYKKCCLR